MELIKIAVTKQERECEKKQNFLRNKNQGNKKIYKSTPKQNDYTQTSLTHVD